MPAQRPRASFEPIPPDLDLDALVESTPSFKYVDRIACDTIDQQGLEAFDRLVLLHVVVGGRPLVIDGYHSRLDPWTFSPKWLQQNLGEKVEQARDLRKENTYTPLTIGHYLRNMSKLAEQYYEKPENYKDLTRQRVYLKDIDCPEVWYDKLKEHLPPNLFYLNSSCGDLGGPGSVDENVPTGGKRKGRGIAGAGDLMSSLPAPMRAENMMCYIGHEGTYTPAHKEMCASIGHNIMVETSDVLGEEGKPERPGSSIWFMTESKDRHTVSEYWLSILGHDIEVERHFAQISAWKAGNFTTYVVDQRPGDLILIPPMAPHQVWNRGTRTMKAAWNRTTVETLELAFKEALPNARMVCRDEQYKNKAIVYYTLQKYAALLAKAKDQQQNAPSPQEAAMLRTSPKIRQLQKDFKRLFRTFKEIMLSEMFAPETLHERAEFFPYDSNITCAYCRGNIFNRFLTCKTCDDLLGTADPEPYDVCMDCYAMGRSCGCISKLRWAEQFKWKELLQKYDTWRRFYVDLDNGNFKPETPLSLQDERARLKQKTLAQICQEQLKRRPWVDVRKTSAKRTDEDEEDEEIEINEDGTVKRKKRKRSEAWLKNNHTCHVCNNRHENWKMAECKCRRRWCYGTLFRGYDQMPQEIMADPDWRCPHCVGVCFAGACRKDPRQKPYEPNGTLLGHDTRKVADARSVESLVDFSVSNLNWLKETAVDAPLNSHRLQRRQEEAEKAKEMDASLDPHYATDDEDPRYRQGEAAGISYSPYPVDGVADNSMIDPSLRDLDAAATPSRVDASVAPSLAALLTGDVASSYNEHDGYQPAQQEGYVAPSAVMLNVPDADGDEEDFSSYPEINGEFGFARGNASSDKRKRASAGDVHDDGIKRLPVKKPRRVIDLESLPGANKQYRREQERKALEEARKAGHYIQLHAALRGKSKIVRLKVGREHIEHIAAEEASKKTGGGNDLLKSDVAPAQPAVWPKALTQSANKPSKAVRIRVERDDDFNSRRRKKTDKDGKVVSRPEEPVYEELDIDSDDSVLGNARTGPADAAIEVIDTGHKRRRTSAWQSQRHQDGDGKHGEDLEALPDDWREGQAGRHRVRKPETTNATQPPTRTTPISNKTTPAKTASNTPARASTQATPDQNIDVRAKRKSTATGKAPMLRTPASAANPAANRTLLPHKAGLFAALSEHRNDYSDEEPTVAAEVHDNSAINLPTRTAASATLLRKTAPTASGKTRHAIAPATASADDDDSYEDEGFADDDNEWGVKGVASSFGPNPRNGISTRNAASADAAVKTVARGGSVNGRGGPAGRMGKIVGARSKGAARAKTAM